MTSLDVDYLRTLATERNGYRNQLERLRRNKRQTSCIEAAVSKASENIKSGAKSFIIYGEPQSGKTEMMICLTAKLIDDGYDVIIHLLNDSVQLLQQNLDRFQRSGLAPAAKNFSDVMDPAISLKTGQHVIFCKKNAKDLAKLIQKTEKLENKIVIDDEADFATPNALINKGEVTAINRLIGELKEQEGIYIGVTATPARLDLNNTFENDSNQWVNFPPHEEYTGQDIFFPIDTAPNYSLVKLPDTDDSPKYLREALFRFMVRVAALNLKNHRDDNYSMLIHTSGKKVDHRLDKKPIDDVLHGLADVHSKKFESYTQSFKRIAEELYGQNQADHIVAYIVRNCSRANIIIMNSERDKNVDFKSATSPAALFTIIIGGNIVSRGVTFDNLLSMYFTRDSKHKIQQDTYIQRARMFGSRKAILPFFELTIPETLYGDWHRCFVFHKLALEAIKENLGSPVWLSDPRIAVASASSIDKANVSIDKGEMSYPAFDFDRNFFDRLTERNIPSLDKLHEIRHQFTETALPDYLLRYVKRTASAGDSIAIHEPASIMNYQDADHQNISRKKGLFGESQRKKFPHATHHFMIFYNSDDKARIIYKLVGDITFIKNNKNV